MFADPATLPVVGVIFLADRAAYRRDGRNSSRTARRHDSLTHPPRGRAAPRRVSPRHPLGRVRIPGRGLPGGPDTVSGYPSRAALLLSTSDVSARPMPGWGRSDPGERP